MNFKEEFKEKYSFRERLDESMRMIEKYPNKIPIICYRHKNSAIKELDKKKMMVPKDINVMQLIYMIRKRIEIDHERTLFLMVSDTVLTSTSKMGDVFNEYKDHDGFLYTMYCCENIFG